MRLCLTVRFPGGATLFVWHDDVPELGSTFMYRGRVYSVRAVHGQGRPVVELAESDADVQAHGLDAPPADQGPPTPDAV